MDPSAGQAPHILLFVGTCPLPPLVEELVSSGAGVIFYGEGVNNPWSGERHFFYLLQDVEGRGRAPFSQCVTDEQCVQKLLTAQKVLTF